MKEGKTPPTSIPSRENFLFFACDLFIEGGRERAALVLLNECLLKDRTFLLLLEGCGCTVCALVGFAYLLMAHEYFVLWVEHNVL